MPATGMYQKKGLLKTTQLLKMPENELVDRLEGEEKKKEGGDSIQCILGLGSIKTQWEKTCHKRDRAEAEGDREI